MKKWLLGLVLVLGGVAVALTLLAVSFRAQTLPVGRDLAASPPDSSPPEGMRVSRLPAGHLITPAAMAYRGGAFDDERVFGMDVVLIEHPEGDLLIDAGFGRDVAAHLRTTPRLMQMLADYDPETPVIDHLAAAGRGPDSLRAVLLTHAHWDHVSGLADLPGVQVWITPAESRFIRSGHPVARLAAELEGIDWHLYDFEHGPYLGFDRSLDFYGDGAVVLVPAGGHTPGSTIVFVNPPQGPRYAFIGDLAWQAEGIELPAERPWLTRRMVDVDGERVRGLLAHLHSLQRAIPDLEVVPSHDRRLFERLPMPVGVPMAEAPVSE